MTEQCGNLGRTGSKRGRRGDGLMDTLKAGLVNSALFTNTPMNLTEIAGVEPVAMQVEHMKPVWQAGADRSNSILPG